MYLAGYAFSMSENASISKNNAIYGGGIYIGSTPGEPGYLMSDNADISNNSANIDGGGVYLAIGEFQMKNGTISGNKAIDGNGGGLYIDTEPIMNTEKFVMSGGKISRNSAGRQGGEIYHNGDADSFIISHDAVVDGNETYLTDGRPVKVEHSLSSPIMDIQLTQSLLMDRFSQSRVTATYFQILLQITLSPSLSKKYPPHQPIMTTPTAT